MAELELLRGQAVDIEGAAEVEELLRGRLAPLGRARGLPLGRTILFYRPHLTDGYQRAHPILRRHSNLKLTGASVSMTRSTMLVGLSDQPTSRCPRECWLVGKTNQLSTLHQATSGTKGLAEGLNAKRNC